MIVDLVLAILFGAGVGLLALGAWMVYPPAGVIVAGLALLLVPVLYVRGRRLG